MEIASTMGEETVSSDLDLTSQIETEDTDMGDMADPSSSSTEQITDGSGTVPTSDSSSSSLDSLNEASGEEMVDAIKLPHVSIDLTDVTELSNFEELSNFDRKNSGCKDDPMCIPEPLTKTGTEKLEMPQFPSKLDFSSSDWFQHKCFKRYWDHYDHVMSWCRKHYQTYNKLQQKSYSQYVQNVQSCYNFPSYHHWPYGQPQSNTGTGHHPYMNMPFVQSQNNNGCQNLKSECSDVSSNSRTKSRRSRRKKQKQRERKKLSSSSSDMVTTGTSEEFEMEITSEMIDFFAKSHEHRKQRDEAKTEEQGKVKVEEHINVEEVKVSNQKGPTVEAPKERPGARRTSEMKMIYGKGAAMIHGMETALQMTFDRNTDIKQPKIWPNMPLKVIFG